jgi:hypothetical protein
MYGGFDKAAKVAPVAASEATNITGSPFGKYGADFRQYGIGNKGFNSSFGKNYLLPKIGGLPITNNYPIVDDYIAPNY